MMKKLTYTKTLLATVVIASILMSCEKIEAPSAVTGLVATDSATISGRVFMNQDTRNDTTGGIQYEGVASGTILIFTVDSEDYAENTAPAGYDYKSVEYKTTVDASSEFSITIPVPSDPVNVDIIADEIMFDQVQPDPDDTTGTGSITELKFFELATVTVQAVGGLTRYQDLTFDEKP